MWYWYVIAALGGLVAGVVIGVIVRKMIGEKTIGSAESEAKRIVEEGKREAQDYITKTVIKIAENIE